ncbi:MAG: tryptophan synthase subunit alpha [Phycisphaeraceae bacterium]|nr:tryptophan synthase subunit alpha [Phycisphaeraceae bacterium]
MARLGDMFARLRAEGRRGLMPFVVAGHPSPEAFRRIVPAIASAGASAIEIGFPFTDPIADGPIIAGAMQGALDQGMTPGRVFEAIRDIRAATAVPLIGMVSVSIVTAIGYEAFCRRAQETGLDGLIVPDVPLDEGAALSEIAARHGLDLALLVAPGGQPERMQAIATASRGFVYLLTRSGITGGRASGSDLSRQVALIREVSDLPIACGFGIATAEQVGEAVVHAEAAIVGSALVQRIGSANDPVMGAAEFVAELSRGLVLKPGRQPEAEQA